MPRSFRLDVRLAEVLHPDTRSCRPERTPFALVLPGVQMQTRIEWMLRKFEIRSSPSKEEDHEAGIGVAEPQLRLRALRALGPVGHDAGDPQRITRESWGFATRRIADPGGVIHGSSVQPGPDDHACLVAGTDRSDPLPLRFGQLDVTAPPRQRPLRDRHDRRDLPVRKPASAQLLPQFPPFPSHQFAPARGALDQGRWDGRSHEARLAAGCDTNVGVTEGIRTPDLRDHNPAL